MYVPYVPYKTVASQTLRSSPALSLLRKNAATD
jgi:hypothetical protein